jgi:predicted deacetylase
MKRTALYSLHDVTPAHGDLVLRGIDHLRQLGANKLTVLVVPDFHGRAPLSRHRDFVRALLQHLQPGDEVALHGYLHRADSWPSAGLAKWKSQLLTAGEGEFAALTWHQAAERMVDGLEMVQDTLQRPVQGFVAPAWLDNPAVRQAASDLGLRWCEDHLWIRDLRGHRKLYAPAVSLASRTLLRRLGSVAQAYAGSVALAAAPVVRLAVHPLDHTRPELVDAIEQVAGRWGRTHTPGVYRDLWPESAVAPLSAQNTTTASWYDPAD